MKPPVLAAGVLVWIGLAVALAKFLKLRNPDFWILIGGLALLGVLAALALWWFSREKTPTEGGVAPPDDKDELENLFREAESRLAKSQLGSGAKFGTLPVFFVVGPAGSTKTTVVLNSGLEPELIGGQVYRDNATVPTALANIWFARKNLLVETAASMLDDSKRWSSLVTRLRPGRLLTVKETRQAPRAALVCFDTETFFRPGGAEASVAAGRKLHARLNDISQRLGISFPVYVLFTRADRISFFLDYVANLTSEEASQVFGVTLPVVQRDARRVYTEEESSRLSNAFDTLYFSLAAKRPEYLSRQNDEAKLPATYEFPREFNKLRNGIVQFLVELGRPSQLSSAPFLRGFYFTGVRPVVVNQTVAASVEREPDQQRLRMASDATSIFTAQKPQTPPAAAQPEIVQRRVPQWVFLSHLFTDVLLADRDALATSGSSSQTSLARRIALGIAAAACLLLAAAFFVSFLNNRALQSRVLTAVQGIAPADAAGSELPSLDSLTRLDRLRQSVAALSEYQSQGAPLSLRWGLYAGNSLLAPTRQLYFEKFHQLLFGAAQKNLLSRLSSLPSSPAASDDYQSAYDTLKSYLITTSNHDKSTRMYLTPVLLDRWLAGRTIDPARLDLARKQFDFYSEELKSANPFSSENDAAAIERARHYLSQFAGAERVYQFMLAEANKANPSINFNAKFPGSAAVVIDSYDVPGAFTKGGWKTMGDDLKHVDRFFNGEQWVLGNQSAGDLDLAKLEGNLSARYTSDFQNAWRTYLKRASVNPYRGIPDAAQKLAVLSGPQSPLLEMFWLASQNTSIDNPAISNAFKPLHAVMPAGAAEQYILPANDAYMKALAALQISLDQVAQQPGAPTDAVAGQTLTNAGNAKLVTRQMAQNFGLDPVAHLETTIEKLMEDPITYTEGLLRGLGPAELNGKGKGLCAQLSPVFNSFPFNSRSKTPATPSDVNSAFKPKEGALWSFYDQNLSKYLQRQGQRYVPDPSAPIHLNPAFVGFFNRAAAFSDMAYAAGSPDPHFSYNVKPVLSEDIESLKLTIDGQTADFTPSSPPKNFTWQPSGAHGVQLTGKYRGGTDFQYATYDGLWAVFEWVGDADAQQGSTLEWSLKAGRGDRPVLSPVTNQPVIVKFNIDNPVFQKSYFSGMGCVSEIARP